MINCISRLPGSREMMGLIASYYRYLMCPNFKKKPKFKQEFTIFQKSDRGLIWLRIIGFFLHSKKAHFYFLGKDIKE